MNSKMIERAAGVSDHIAYSNGRRKTVCTSAVLAAFGIDISNYHYSDSRYDVCRILRRNGWSVRSRKSSIPRNASMGKLRAWLFKNGEYELGARYYVGVPGHAILLSAAGETIVDTSPRRNDRRRIKHIFRVTRKG